MSDFEDDFILDDDDDGNHDSENDEHSKDNANHILTTEENISRESMNDSYENNFILPDDESNENLSKEYNDNSDEHNFTLPDEDNDERTESNESESKEYDNNSDNGNSSNEEDDENDKELVNENLINDDKDDDRHHNSIANSDSECDNTSSNQNIYKRFNSNYVHHNSAAGSDDENCHPQPASNLSIESDNDSENILAMKTEEEMQDILSQSERYSQLSSSLKFAKTSTNQLYSLLYCIDQDVEHLITRNRTNCSVNIHTEVSLLDFPNIKYENGSIQHKKFKDGYDCRKIKSEEDHQELISYFECKRTIIDKALPSIVQNALKLLKDPLVKQHHTYKAMKQKINNLKRSNHELSAQTRQTANKLVKLSKMEGKKTLEPTVDKSDVIIQQQRLQKALTRVHDLKKSNESAMLSNTKLHERLNAKEEKCELNKKEQKVSNDIVKLKQKISELTNTVEQLEGERETTLSQRRVSLAKMNDSIDKSAHHIARLEALIIEVDTKLKLMTQGKAPSSLAEKKAPSSLAEKKFPSNLKGEKPLGSKIPHLQKRAK